MQISAIIPSFNRRHCLERALQSVVEQSSPAEEIILIDDGSSDGSSEWARQRYPEVKIIRQQNLGVSAARNRGISQAQHDWIAFLDSDDSWHRNKLERIRQAQLQSPDYVLYHSDEIWVRKGVRVNPMDKHRKQGGWIFDHCLALCAISPSTVVMRKDILLSLGMFDETLPACEDYDLWLRLCHRYPVHFSEQALVTRYAGHEDQLSQQYWGMDRFRIRALANLLGRHKLSPDAREASRQMLLRKLKILLNGAHKRGNQAVVDEFTPLLSAWRDDLEPGRC